MESEYVEIKVNGETLKLAAWPQPGHADDSITVYLGYGRQKAGRVGDKAGENAYKARTAGAFWTPTGAEITKVNEAVNVACTQAHQSMEGRKPVRLTTVHVLADKFKSDKIKVAGFDADAPILPAAQAA